MPDTLPPSCGALGAAAARYKHAAPQLFRPELHAPAPDNNPGVLAQIGENYGRFFDAPWQQLQHVLGGEYHPGGGRPNNFTPQQALQQRYPWWNDPPAAATPAAPPAALADRTWSGFQKWWQGRPQTLDDALQTAANSADTLRGGPPSPAAAAPPTLDKLQAGLGSGLETARNFVGQHPYASSAAGLGLAAYLYNQHRQNQQDQERQQMLQALAASGGGGGGGGGAGRPSRVMEYL